jgi:hypothetical protein
MRYWRTALRGWIAHQQRPSSRRDGPHTVLFLDLYCEFARRGVLNRPQISMPLNCVYAIRPPDLPGIVSLEPPDAPRRPRARPPGRFGLLVRESQPPRLRFPREALGGFSEFDRRWRLGQASSRSPPSIVVIPLLGASPPFSCESDILSQEVVQGEHFQAYVVPLSQWNH